MGPPGLPSDSQTAQLVGPAFQKVLALFEVQAGYPGVQTEIHDGLAGLPKRLPADNAERLRILLACFDVHAKAFLRLISDIQLQNGFMALLDAWAGLTWLQYAGYAIDLRSPHPDVEALRSRAEHWKNEGYIRLATSETQIKKSSASLPTKTSSSKRTFREPRPELLDGKESLNRKQTAVALGVTERTLDRWIAEGKLTPVGDMARKRCSTREIRKILSQRSADKPRQE